MERFQSHIPSHYFKEAETGDLQTLAAKVLRELYNRDPDTLRVLTLQMLSAQSANASAITVIANHHRKLMGPL